MTVPDGTHVDGTYRDLTERALSPTLFKGEKAAAFIGVLVGLMGDLVAEHIFQAVKARMMLSDTFPADALSPIGNERQIERYAPDTNQSYRERLVKAWDAWAGAGGEAGIRGQLEAFGLTDIEFRTNFAWDWDSMPENWSRIWVIINGNPFIAPGTYGDGSVYGAEATYGSNATDDEVRAIRRIVRKFKSGHIIVVHIIIVLDSGVWVPIPTGDWDVWENRNTGAIYWDG